MVRPLVLDTDIGSDVDDALALAVLLGSPEVRLVGVTTVYGDTLLRARIARRLAGLAERKVPCVPGEGHPLSGREVWLSGEEGALLEGLDSEHVEDSRPVGAWLLDRARELGGELEILAIGPLTNLAAALREDPAFARLVRRLWVMGGRYDDPAAHPPEHNLRSDAVAAAEVFASGIPMTLVGLETTRRVRLDDSQVARIGRAGGLGAALERETRAWMAVWKEAYDVPHDAVAALALLEPDHFTLESAAVSVREGGERAGEVVLHDAADPATAEVVRDLDVRAVTAAILERIEAVSRDALSFRAAESPDVPAIVALVESAYRGEASRAGWTTEADLLAGQRTDAAEITEVVAGPSSRMVLAEAAGGLVGCCQLERRGSGVAYFGTFAVRPDLQGSGVGSALLGAAERWARVTWGAVTMEMTVLAQRTELISWYARRGYLDTGQTRPFPYGDERKGVPQRSDLVFSVLRKRF